MIDIELIVAMTGATPSDKIVLLTLFDLIEQGFDTLSQDQIAASCDLGRRTVSGSLSKWQKAGVIDWEKGRHQNTYVMFGLTEEVKERIMSDRVDRLNKVKVDSSKRTTGEREKVKAKRELTRKKKKLSIAELYGDPEEAKKKQDPAVVQGFKNFQKAYIRLYLEQYEKASLPRWSPRGKEAGQAKMFISRCDGADNAIKVLEWVFRNWTDLRRQWKLNPMVSPDIGVILAYTKAILPEIMIRAKVTKPIESSVPVKDDPRLLHKDDVIEFSEDEDDDD